MQAIDRLTRRDRVGAARPGILLAFTSLLDVGVAGAQDDVESDLGAFAGKPILGERSEIVGFFVPPNDMNATIYDYVDATMEIIAESRKE